MKERPILFNGEMVLALLDRGKTQTRRIIKPRKNCPDSGRPLSPREIAERINRDRDWRLSKYGKPGDRLWVRETFHRCPHCTPAEFVAYRAGGCRDACYGIDNDDDGPLRPQCAAHGWRPSIHMPRWASRITREITGVRAELLQEISQGDAKAEGCMPPDLPPELTGVAADYVADERTSFAILWNRINGPGSWAANPWVWVIEFRRVAE